jgi:hypothetical protein
MNNYHAYYWFKGQRVNHFLIAPSAQSVEQDVREGLAHLPEFQKSVRIKVKKLQGW